MVKSKLCERVKWTETFLKKCKTIELSVCNEGNSTDLCDFLCVWETETEDKRREE